MPYNSLGSVPVLEAISRSIPVFAIRENTTVLDVDAVKLGIKNSIIEVPAYDECLKLILKS